MRDLLGRAPAAAAALLPAVLLAVLLALLLVGGAAAPASAHANLVSTDPVEGAILEEAPEQVTFTFDEPVSLVADGLQVFDATGAAVEVAAGSRDEVVTGDLGGGLDDGTYVVTWRVVSADGHPIAGSLTFHVGAPSEEVVPPGTAAGDLGGGPVKRVLAVVTAVDYVLLLTAGGLVVFLGWVTRGVRLRADVRRRLVRITRIAAGGAVLAAAVVVPLSGAYQQGSGLGGVLEGASYDVALVGDDLLVLVLQAFGLGAAGWAVGRERGGAPPVTGDLGAAAAVWSPAVVGHTRAYEPESLLVVTDALHLTAGAVWLGGLVGLVVALPSLAGGARAAASVLARFSTVGASVLGALAITGLLIGWRILGSWSALFGETYGRLLLVKVGIAAVVAAIAGWNRFRLVPAVTGSGGHDGARRGAGLVRRAVAAEGCLLVALLAVTGFLVVQAPKDEPFAVAGPAAAEPVPAVVVGDVRVLALVSDGPGLQRALTVQLQDEQGEPIDLYGAPAVSLRTAGGSGDADVDLGEIPVEPIASGTYRADVTFPLAGTWAVQVSVRADEFDNPVTTVEVEVD